METSNNQFMTHKIEITTIIGWLFALIVMAFGLANLMWVHPVPGILYLIIALLYIPQTNILIKKNFGFAIPAAVKVILGIVIIMFTLGVSDLGDMIDKL